MRTISVTVQQRFQEAPSSSPFHEVLQPQDSRTIPHLAPHSQPLQVPTGLLVIMSEEGVALALLLG